MIEHCAVGSADKALVGVRAIQSAALATPGAGLHKRQLRQQRGRRFLQSGVEAGFQPCRPRRAQTFEQCRRLPFAAEKQHTRKQTGVIAKAPLQIRGRQRPALPRVPGVGAVATGTTQRAARDGISQRDLVRHLKKLNRMKANVVLMQKTQYMVVLQDKQHNICGFIFR